MKALIVFALIANQAVAKVTKPTGESLVLTIQQGEEKSSFVISNKTSPKIEFRNNKGERKESPISNANFKFFVNFFKNMDSGRSFASECLQSQASFSYTKPGFVDVIRVCLSDSSSEKDKLMTLSRTLADFLP